MIPPLVPHREATAWSVWSLAAGLLIVGKRQGGRIGKDGREKKKEIRSGWTLGAPASFSS